MSSWIPPLTRAVPAIALALAITFSADHSASLGLVTFGIFVLVTGAATIVVALLWSRGTPRTVQVLQGGIGVLAGIAALTVIGGGLAYLVLLVSAWGILTGALEMYLGVQARSTAPVAARDAMFAGALTVVLAIVVQIVPPGFSQTVTFDDASFELTASVIVVGLLGAYWAVLGVYLAIAAASPRRPATTPAAEPVADRDAVAERRTEETP